MSIHVRALASLTAVIVAVTSVAGQEGFRFKSGVELVNVTATVSDRDGRFVPGLSKDDFVVYDNGKRQEITQFSNERVPVSLGIVLDASGSMSPDKMRAARAAIARMTGELLDADDELFLMQFANTSRLLQDWTVDRGLIATGLTKTIAAGGTAMYDAIADALPIAAQGRHQKKALLVISDGNDTNSALAVGELRQAIRESEVMVYALGVDGTEDGVRIQTRPRTRPGTPFPIPLPFPGGRRPGGGFPQILGGPTGWPSMGGERVNGNALRQITDDSGGRTEIIRSFQDLDAATSRIADELRQQYYLGYASSAEKDGKWHAIRVEVPNQKYTVRARRGYIAS